MPLSYQKYLGKHSMEKPGPEHDLFRQWVVEQDIKVNGIAPVKLPGRGIGIVAERNIEANEELVHVPASALLQTDSIVEEVKDAALSSGISVHGLLAMYLAVTAQQEEDPYAEWRRVWPSRDELSTLPILWPYALRGLKKSPAPLGTWSPLPPSINGEWSSASVSETRYAGLATSASRLEKMRRKVDKDWTRAKALCEGRLVYEDYLYHWLIVNTRSFYFDIDSPEDGGSSSNTTTSQQEQEQQQQQQPKARDDCMALCPFIDYFNHASKGCTVAFNEEGYFVTADRAYQKGEELLVSYGEHDNDLLLAEYGFILTDGSEASASSSSSSSSSSTTVVTTPNRADAVPLDDIVLFGPSGVYKWKTLLATHDYFGEYRLGNDGQVCYRTQVAAAVQLLAEGDWVAVVKGTRELSEAEKAQVDAIVRDKWLTTWLKEADRALAAWDDVPGMSDPKEVPEAISRLATGRWRQIRGMLLRGIKELEQ